MGQPNFSDEFKPDGVAQITEWGNQTWQNSLKKGLGTHPYARPITIQEIDIGLPCFFSSPSLINAPFTGAIELTFGNGT